jgi:hypothetical protein
MIVRRVRGIEVIDYDGTVVFLPNARLTAAASPSIPTVAARRAPGRPTARASRGLLLLVASRRGACR